jgi:hypothetical protein
VLSSSSCLEGPVAVGREKAVSGVVRKVQTTGGDYNLPLKLDQSEKSEELRGSGSRLVTSSIWR